ncbi:glycerophosphodiester phosphodiesterase family protein [Nocardioides speluncae]|uniref:glycerophosphodiester phosphodiesterase family protein n=1 Tax=Nocardioides speluncae TaxID=2670337 RepID=UPI000D694A78|nr:glycerophosphodiester phosphodiesterase family protein [Nocardioides speluncae]
MGTRLTEAFDLQAHRGGAGLYVENTLAAFGHALDLGVTTLECDVHVTADGVAAVTHDRKLDPAKLRGAYVGQYLTRLTWAQVSTLDAGSLTQDAFPGQRSVPGARMPRLEEVFALLAARGADGVQVNVETKYEVLAPTETAPRERFVDVVTGLVRDAGLVDRVSVQSFDWGLLAMVREAEPGLRLNALTSGHYLEAGMPGASPWLGGLDIDEYDGNLVAAAASYEFDAVSPIHGSPFATGVEDPAYRPFVTPAMVDQAHEAGMRVIPYTVDDPPTMKSLINLGVDGLITNYPDRLRDAMMSTGLPLPAAYPSA